MTLGRRLRVEGRADKPYLDGNKERDNGLIHQYWTVRNIVDLGDVRELTGTFEVRSGEQRGVHNGKLRTLQTFGYCLERARINPVQVSYKAPTAKRIIGDDGAPYWLVFGQIWEGKDPERGCEGADRVVKRGKIIAPLKGTKGTDMEHRNELRKRDGQRFRCRALVERYGHKAAFRGLPIETILLRNVVDVATGTLLTDHIWFTAGQWARGIRAGSEIEFDARVGDYIKGYQGGREVYDAPVQRDWKLQRPTKVTVIQREEVTA